MIFVILRIVRMLLSLLELAILLECILSFLPMVQNGFTRLIHALTGPILSPIRALLFRIPGLSSLPLDFSPIVAIFVLSFLQRLLYF